MILLGSILISYKYLITASDTMSMKELTIDYVTVYLMYKMLERKEGAPR